MNKNDIDNLISLNEQLREEVMYHAEQNNMVRLVEAFTQYNLQIIDTLMEYHKELEE